MIRARYLGSRVLCAASASASASASHGHGGGSPKEGAGAGAAVRAVFLRRVLSAPCRCDVAVTDGLMDGVQTFEKRRRDGE
jgi:hypothetical protein